MPASALSSEAATTVLLTANGRYADMWAMQQQASGTNFDEIGVVQR
jgi:ATP-binding cassette subfamily B protein